MEDYNLYNIAYKYLLYSIHFGFYPSGSRLPTVPELCDFFAVSRSTIHNALKMLENEQYVSLSQGRSAQVTYTAEPETCRAHYAAYCQATKDALLDLSEIIYLIWPETLLQGLKLCDEQDLQVLSELVDGMTRQVEYPFLAFYYRILEHLGNPLLLNLYLSTILFGHCTAAHLSDDAYRERYMVQLRGTCLEVIALRRAQKYPELKALLIRNYQRRIEAIQHFYHSIPLPNTPVERLPYRWNYYTQRPLVGFDLAMTLLREIYTYYRPMEYLPSVAALSKQYSIPIITVRRAIQILNEIGVTESINGKGTRVLVGSGTTVKASCLSTPNMKKVLLPYLQSTQAILLICKDLVQALFPTLPDEAVRSTLVTLREILASGEYSTTFGAAFKLLLDHSPSPALREILGGFLHFQYLGYPLKDLEPKGLQYDPRPTRALLESLEARDAARFAEELQKLMAGIFLAGKEKLISGGIPEAEAIVTPSLQLQ